MSLEEKLARALAASYILGRNNTFSSVDELWESWLPEARRVLENHITFSHEAADILNQPLAIHSIAISSDVQTVKQEPLNPNIPQ